MADLNFPNSPTDGQEYEGYIFDSAVGAWINRPSVVANNESLRITAAFNAANSVNTYSNVTYVKLTAPSQTITGNLSIAGNLSISSTLSADGRTGNSGQVLTSAGSGNVYWSTVAGVGSIPSIFSANVGNNTNTSFSISHNLNTRNIFTSIREISSGYFVYPDVKLTTSNTIVLEFATAPTTNQYYVAMLGGS